MFRKVKISPLETEIGTRSGYFTFWIRSTNTAAHTAMMMEMANAGVKLRSRSLPSR